MGTLVTLNAYLWLLKNTTAALAGSYSFVNPLVALWVGVVIGGERLTGWVFVAMPLILLALLLILYGRSPWVMRGAVWARQQWQRLCKRIQPPLSGRS
jgi:drug/metabolite transporter (DMT)-like permease